MRQFGSVVAARNGTPRPQHVPPLGHGVHVALGPSHPASPMVLWPAHCALSHAAHSEALRYEWQHIGQLVHGGASSAHTSVDGILQHAVPAGHVRGGKKAALTLHEGPAASARAASAPTSASARCMVNARAG